MNFVTRNNGTNNDNQEDNDERNENEENNIRYEWIEIPLLSSQSEITYDINPFSSQQTLNIRSIKSSLSLMESHVGEEVWDAAKLFCIYLCTKLSNCDNVNDIDVAHHTTASHKKNEKPPFFPTVTAKAQTIQLSDGDDNIDIHIKGKRILELGAGCGLLGMCCSTLGASEVLCTDYLPEVMSNLAYNLKYNMDTVKKQRKDANHDCNGWIKCGVLDWKDFIAPDLKEVDWILDDSGGIETCRTNAAATKNDDKDNYNYNHNVNGGDGVASQEEDVFFVKQASTFEPDILIGSALVYSVQGAMYCADTIHYFFETHQTKEVCNFSPMQNAKIHM